MNGEIFFAEVPGDVQSHRPWHLLACVCINSQLRNREILSIRAGEEPMGSAGPTPLFYR